MVIYKAATTATTSKNSRSFEYVTVRRCLRAVPRFARPSGRTDPRRGRVSVFVGAHDRQDAGSDGGIGGIRGAHLGRAVVAIDFPEVADAALVDRPDLSGLGLAKQGLHLRQLCHGPRLVRARRGARSRQRVGAGRRRRGGHTSSAPFPHRRSGRAARRQNSALSGSSSRPIQHR